MASREQQVAYARRRRDKVERQLAVLFQRSLTRVINETLATVEIPGIRAQSLTAAMNSNQDLNSLMQRWKAEVDKNILPAMEQAFLAQAFQTSKALGVALGPNIRDVRAVQYLDSIRARIEGVGQTTLDSATSAFRDAVGSGLSVPKQAQAIRDALKGQVDLARATTIARTEAGSVINSADHSVTKELRDQGFTIVRSWLATGDRRTRDSHRAVDGHPESDEGTWLVGGSTLAYPGDPAGSAEETVNCRCTTTSEITDGGPGVALSAPVG